MRYKKMENKFKEIKELAERVESQFRDKELHAEAGHIKHCFNYSFDKVTNLFLNNVEENHLFTAVTIKLDSVKSSLLKMNTFISQRVDVDFDKESITFDTKFREHLLLITLSVLQLTNLLVTLYIDNKR